MDYGHLFRRAFHLCAPIILVYYLLPHRFLGFSKEAWLLLGLFGLLLLEAGRLFTGRIFFGLREYERKQISAYAWAGIGVTIAFLFFPMPFVICSVVGLGWTDPLIGEMRKRKMMRYYPATPLAVYFLIAAVCLFVFSDFTIIQVFILGFVGSVAAISVEKPKLPIDDDFLMLVVPLAVLTLVYEYLNIAGLV
jgi:dolichol kinase